MMTEWNTVLTVIRQMRYRDAMKLADDAKVPRGTLAKLRNGESQNPRISTVEALERAVRSRLL